MNSVTFPMLNSYANFVLKKIRWSSLFQALIAWWWVGMWCVLVNSKAVTIHSCFWAEWQWKTTVPGLMCSDFTLDHSSHSALYKLHVNSLNWEWKVKVCTSIFFFSQFGWLYKRNPSSSFSIFYIIYLSSTIFQ